MATILIVDDDETIRETLYDLLSYSHVCYTAETAEDALARLQTHPYDVVLTDISMPGLSGLELLGHILQLHSDTPVIMISGIGDQEHAQGLIRLGAFDFLLKPFSLEVVEESVSRAVGHRQRLLEDSVSSGPLPNSEANLEGSADWKIVRD